MANQGKYLGHLLAPGTSGYRFTEGTYEVAFTIQARINFRKLTTVLGEGYSAVTFALDGDQLYVGSDDVESLARVAYRWGQLEEKLADGDYHAWLSVVDEAGEEVARA